jgi:hypothetical protein
MSLAKVAAPSPSLPRFPFGMQPGLIVPASRSRAKEHWINKWVGETTHVNEPKGWPGGRLPARSGLPFLKRGFADPGYVPRKGSLA